MSVRRLKSDLYALWSVGWRMVLITPLVALPGLVALIVAIICPFLLPVAGLLIYVGEYLYGSIAAVVWVLWFLFRRQITKFVFEGFEHSAM